jgi:ElaB/YqjD/DUF883 family membrane-anchored ribosome-binding protein
MNEFTDIPNPFDTPSAADPFASAKASALKAAEDLRTAATLKAQEIRSAAEQRASQFKDVAGEKAGQFKEYADKAMGEAGAQLKNITADAEKFAREKPMQALLTAFGVGFVVGLILRK